MPPFPGEETLATVYTDVHTYFAAPSPRPFLHRFDKGSYFYLYYNSTRHTTRIELALNPGTPDQAAFNGYLDSVQIINSQQSFPTRLTLVVDADAQQHASPTSPRAGRDPDEWRLASSDPRDPGTTKYRIHTIDFYFWTQEDAKLIVDICKRLLEPHQLEVDPEEEDEEEEEAAPAEHREPQHHDDLVSPVVQNLENVAISDPAYHRDRFHGSPGASAAAVAAGAAAVKMVAQSPPPNQAAAAAAARQGQPVASPSPSSFAGNVDRRSSVKAPAATENYAPLAYNPAAPPAPEPIAHREKTPPPVDAADGTGLTTAAAHDRAYAQQPYGQAYSGVPGPQPSPYGHYGSPPPPSFGPHSTVGGSAAVSPQPPPSFGPQSVPAAGPPSLTPSYGRQSVSSALQTSPRTSVSTNFGPPPTGSATGSPDTTNTSRHPSAAGQTYVPAQAQDPNAHIFGQQQSVQSPGAQFYNSLNDQQHHKPLAHVQPQYPDYLAAGQPPPPTGGYANYHYGHASQPAVGVPPAASPHNPYDIHNQVYRPTEAEHQTHHHSKPSKSSSSHKEPSTVERIDKGLGKFFKKVEKKIG